MSTGNKGKFSERLKRILFWKRKKNNIDTDNNIAREEGSLKRFFLIPLMLIQKKVDNPTPNNNVSDSDNSSAIDKEEIEVKLEKIKREAVITETEAINEDVISVDNKIIEEENNDRKLKVQNIKNIDVVLLRKIHDDNLNRFVNQKKELDNLNEDEQSVYSKSVNLKKEELEKEILNMLKKELVKEMNELEIIQSDLFVLKEIENNDILYNECSENLIEIKKIISKIKSLKEKYDYLKDNTDFEFMFDMDNEPLYDKIIELKNLLETDKVSFVVDDYKLLEEYKFLYLKIDKYQEAAEKYEEEKNKKALELKSRDIDFEKFKENIDNVSSLSSGYEKFVEEQDHMMKELVDKIDVIDSIEKTTYSYKGFGKLLGSSFKYLGLLLMNPLKGLFPNIAIQTVATKQIISNLRDSMKLEEKHYTVYEAVDYSKEIDLALSDIDYTSSLIDNSLKDIVSLKSTFKKKFAKYNSDFKDYQEAIKKLNKIENTIINNKIKIDIIRNKMLENEKINSEKMAKVLKMNEKMK